VFGYNLNSGWIDPAEKARFTEYNANRDPDGLCANRLANALIVALQEEDPDLRIH